MTLNHTCSACHLTTTTASVHRTADGVLSYHRCVCGQWSVLLDGEPLGSAGRAELITAPALQTA